MVVGAAGRAHEDRAPADLGAHDLEAEDTPIELGAALSVAHEEDGMIEAGDGDHPGILLRERLRPASGSGRVRGRAGQLPAILPRTAMLLIISHREHGTGPRGPED
jgi:hypothetical protein